MYLEHRYLLFLSAAVIVIKTTPQGCPIQFTLKQCLRVYAVPFYKASHKSMNYQIGHYYRSMDFTFCVGLTL